MKSDDRSKIRVEFRQGTSETTADAEQEGGKRRGGNSQVPEVKREKMKHLGGRREIGQEEFTRRGRGNKTGFPTDEEGTGTYRPKERDRGTIREPRSLEEAGIKSSKKGGTEGRAERRLRGLEAGETAERGTNERKQVDGKDERSIGSEEERGKSEERVRQKDGRRKEKIMGNMTVRFEIGERDEQARADKGRNAEEGREFEAIEMEKREGREGLETRGQVEDKIRGVETRVRREPSGGVEDKTRGVETRERRRRLYLFMVVTCTAALCYVSMTVYTTGVVRTLERRFSLTSFRTGLIRSGNDIGHISAVVFVAYFGRKVNRLRTLSLSVFLAAVAGFLMATPHFFLASSSPLSSTAISSNGTSAMMKSTQSNLCGSEKFSSDLNTTSASSSASVAFSSSSIPLFSLPSSSSSSIATPYHSLPSSYSSFSPSSSSSSSSPDFGNGQVQETEEGIHLVFYVFLIAHLIKGVGGSGIFALSLSYVDEYTSGSKSAFYTGVMTSIYSVGPIVGMTLSAVCLALPETLLSPPVEAPTDATWIGCWWLGYLVSGAVLMLASLVLCIFPTTSTSSHSHLPTSANNFNEAPPARGPRQDHLSFKAEVKEFGRTTVSLFVRNPLFLVNLLQTVCDAFVITGVQTNVVRFIEIVFSRSASAASIIAGLASAVPGALGSFCGGLIMSRLRHRRRRPLANAIRLMLLSSGTLLMGLIVVIVLFIWCPEIQMAGQRDPRSNRFTVESECNSHCACSTSRKFFAPVCGSDGLTYFSGCFAGCKDVINETLTGCGCVQLSATDYRERSTALPGICDATASSSFSASNLLIPFAAILFVMSLMATASRVPATIVNFRIVSDDERFTAFGINSFAFNVFGLIPSAILSGYLIDSSCLLWEQTDGACLHFSTTWFRYLTLGGPAIFEAACFVLVATLLCLVKRKRNSSSRKTFSADRGRMMQERRSGDDLRLNYVAVETIVTHL